jgi:hypothetical protein
VYDVTVGRAAELPGVGRSKTTEGNGLAQLVPVRITTFAPTVHAASSK